MKIIDEDSFIKPGKVERPQDWEFLKVGDVVKVTASLVDEWDRFVGHKGIIHSITDDCAGAPYCTVKMDTGEIHSSILPMLEKEENK